jgi:hypothetical protein
MNFRKPTAAAVRCNGWILIIASQGWERAYPKE